MDHGDLFPPDDFTKPGDDGPIQATFPIFVINRIPFPLQFFTQLTESIKTADDRGVIGKNRITHHVVNKPFSPAYHHGKDHVEDFRVLGLR
jgi:hypothetical protein